MANIMEATEKWRFHMFITLVSISGTITMPSINYTWLQYNDKYDALVGISLSDKPVCTGVLVAKYHVITSANPIYVQVKFYSGNPTLYVHAIAGAYNKTVVHAVQSVTYQARRGAFFRPFGFDNRHTPVHDIAILALVEPMETFTEVIRLPKPGPWGDTTTIREVRFPPYRQRHYSMRPVMLVEKFDSNGWFSIAGHGFLDKLHVRDNIELEVANYKVEDVLENCDEWVPRAWGHFICISNINDFVGVGAGSALFYNRRFIGIGGFSLLKGNESILLFTDLRKYKGMKGTRGFVDVLYDDKNVNPDDVTPRSYWFYLTHLAAADIDATTPGYPLVKENFPYWFWYR